MKAEYWTLPDTLAKFRDPIYNDLVKLLTAKVEYIQYCYSQELSANQVKRLQQDEELIDKYGEYIGILSNQLETLTSDFVALCEQYTNVIHQKNKIEHEYLNGALKELKTLVRNEQVAA